jgi:tRNA nucleotidyltransferase/poly(A) polymerase
MREAVGFLPQVSAERLRDELFKILSGPKVALAIRLLDRVGALHYTLPELEGLKGVAQTPPHVMDVWEHTLSTLQHLEQLLQRWLGNM